MDEDATWYGSRPWPRPHCIRRGPSSSAKGAQHPLFSAHVYCGHGRPSQPLLSSCSAILSNYSGTTAYICRRLIPTTAFLVLFYSGMVLNNHLSILLPYFVVCRQFLSSRPPWTPKAAGMWSPSAVTVAPFPLRNCCSRTYKFLRWCLPKDWWR